MKSGTYDAIIINGKTHRIHKGEDGVYRITVDMISHKEITTKYLKEFTGVEWSSYGCFMDTECFGSSDESLEKQMKKINWTIQ